MSNLYLFTGENDYLRSRERFHWIAEFRLRHGPENCVVLDGARLTVRSLLDEVSVLPFLAEKRLIVVDGVPRCTKEEIELLVRNIHPQAVVLFVDAKPDKRLTGVKALIAEAQVKGFAPLSAKLLEQWLTTYVAEKGSRFAPGVAAELMQAFGNDQQMLATEVEKLALFAGGKPITLEDIDAMTMASDEGVIWRMTDLLGSGKKREAARAARQMQERGVSAFQLWSMLLSFLQNVVLVRSAVNERMGSSKQIADATGVHVFALRALQSYASHVQDVPLQRFVRWAADADMCVKTGALRSTDEFPQEMESLIDQFLLRCP